MDENTVRRTSRIRYVRDRCRIRQRWFVAPGVGSHALRLSFRRRGRISGVYVVGVSRVRQRVFGSGGKILRSRPGGRSERRAGGTMVCPLPPIRQWLRPSWGAV